MPFLTFPIGADGVLVDIHVALSTPRVDVLKAMGMSYPAPFKARALIDTGAARSGISPQIASALGLKPTGTIAIISATTGAAAHNCNLYDVSLAFVQPLLKVGA
jgi:predicted aspartyl protease